MSKMNRMSTGKTLAVFADQCSIKRSV